MKVIIAGSRDILDYDLVCSEIARFPHKITEVVSGAARGVDSLGELWAWENDVLVRKFAAKWNLYGNRAGPIRNRLMAEYVGAGGGCIIVRYSDSRGSKSMSEIARELGLVVQELVIERSS